MQNKKNIQRTTNGLWPKCTTGQHKHTPKNYLPLLNLPEFPSHTYRTIMQALHMDANTMARSFLTTLLQTEIRNSELFQPLDRKTGPKLQSYAAAASDRLPIAAKPKKIPNLKPMVPTQYPCAKCLTTATIFTTTDKKYTDKLTIAPRFKSLEEYTKTLPLALRKHFVETFNTITQGYPNHQEIKGWPLANHPEKRSNFYKVAPNKAPAIRTSQDISTAGNRLQSNLPVRQMWAEIERPKMSANTSAAQHPIGHAQRNEQPNAIMAVAPTHNILPSPSGAVMNLPSR
ncbi:hypothetical protein LOD99_10951 [Oopsacas minuta]|uniref:Uncharacterized protein n=1 Tax=Oopsacas minuta TaxID=111878 RepID=A0AAV7KDM0_9METZ|nr:hypothetical protein LOD99_10951 [Oopsacas minuta]